MDANAKAEYVNWNIRLRHIATLPLTPVAVKRKVAGMADSVIGIAVLETESAPQKLHVLCHRDGKSDLRETIDVYPEGSAKPCDPAWSYRTDGEMITVTPSLHIRVQAHLPESQEWTTWFHNDGRWSVKFVHWPGREGAWAEFQRINGLERE